MIQSRFETVRLAASKLLNRNECLQFHMAVNRIRGVDILLFPSRLERVLSIRMPLKLLSLMIILRTLHTLLGLSLTNAIVNQEQVL